MSKQWSAGAAALALTLTLTTLTACNGSSSGAGSPAAVNTLNSYSALALVGNGDAIVAPRRDENLQDPRGVVFAGGKAWVANAGSRTVTVYDALGIAQPTIVRIPDGDNGDARPTGIVYNGSSTDFRLNSPGATGSAQVIVATDAGTLAAWAPGATVQSGAINAYDDGAGRAHYTGLALLDVNGSRFLYAADFRNGKIDTFDNQFRRIATIGGFIDTSLPAGYAPFGIHAIGNRLIVTYARQGDTPGGAPVSGAGKGYVNEFDGSGRFERRIAAGEHLNAPWGVAVAPSDFGRFSRTLLIANHGDGRVHAFDGELGTFTGTLNDTRGKALTIPGLWSLSLAYTLGTAPGDGTGGTGTDSGTGSTGTPDGSDDGAGSNGGSGAPGIDLGGFSPISIYYTAGSSSSDSADADAGGSFGRIDVAQPDTGEGGSGTNGDENDPGSDGDTTTGGGTSGGSGGGTSDGSTGNSGSSGGSVPASSL